jgi:hypothetical protein
MHATRRKKLESLVPIRPAAKAPTLPVAWHKVRPQREETKRWRALSAVTSAPAAEGRMIEPS